MPRPTPTQCVCPSQDASAQTHLKTTAHNLCQGVAESTKTLVPMSDALPHTTIAIRSAAQLSQFVAVHVLSKSASEQAVIPTALRPRPRPQLPHRETPPEVQGRWHLVFFESLLLFLRSNSSVLRTHRLQSKTKRPQDAPGTRFVKTASRFLFNPCCCFLGCP